MLIPSLLAQRIKNPLGDQLSPKSSADGVTSFSNFLSTIVGWLFVVGILAFVLFFFINAFKYIASQGDKQGIESARQGLLHALIGLIILFGFYALLLLIQQVFGVCMLKIVVPVLGQTVSTSCN